MVKEEITAEHLRLAVAHWRQLGFAVDFQAVDNHQLSPPGEFNYQVEPNADNHGGRDSLPGTLIINYPRQFNAYYFFYQNAEAWAIARGQLGADSDKWQVLRTRAEIISELIDIYPPAVNYQRQRIKDIISALNHSDTDLDSLLMALGPRLAALNAWDELLPIIGKLNKPLAQNLQYWRRQEKLDGRV